MNQNECGCEKCKECCRHNPGWFGSIEEIEGAGKIKQMNVKEFCKEYLIREWWAGEDDIYIPAPRRNFLRKENPDRYEGIVWDEEIERNGKGFVMATWGHNFLRGWACIFLDDNNLCEIHQSKPTECRKVFGCKESDGKKIREDLVTYWKNHQDWIKKIAKEINE